MNLSKNFTLSELLQSQTATRKNIEEQFQPSQTVVENLKKLCEHILQPLRDHIGKSIRVTSGYRCKRLNKAIGGSLTSQHSEGKAVDIEVDGFTNEELFNFIVNLKLPFDQLINEFAPDGWIHISYDDKRNRREKLIATKKGGKTIYQRI